MFENNVINEMKHDFLLIRDRLTHWHNAAINAFSFSGAYSLSNNRPAYAFEEFETAAKGFAH